MKYILPLFFITLMGLLPSCSNAALFKPSHVNLTPSYELEISEQTKHKPKVQMGMDWYFK